MADASEHPDPDQLGALIDDLLARGDVTGLLELVATRFAVRPDAGDLAEVAAVVSALPDGVLAQRPTALLELARACESEGRIRLRTRLLQRAARLRLDGPFAAALEAEEIVDRARDAGGATARERGEQLLTRLDATDEASVLVREARARTAYAVGRTLAWEGDPISVAAAEDHLGVAAGAARALGRIEWRAQALQALGFSVHFYRGEEVPAERRLREAVDALPVGHPRRPLLGTFLAEVQVRSHRPDEAAAVLEQVRDEASVTGDQRALGYAAWLGAMAASELGQPTRTTTLLAEAERHPGDWFAHLTGTEFCADAAMAADRVGAHALADAYLDRATRRAIDEGYPDTAWLAGGTIHARRGEPSIAVDLLGRLLEQPWLPPRDLWTVHLHLALARLRGQDPRGAAEAAVRAFELASVLVGPGRAAPTPADLPATLVRLEPEAVTRLAALAAAAGSSVAAAIRPAGTRISLFGGLDVRVGGAPVAGVPSGRPALLVMILALAGHPVPVDVVLEELWPDTAPDLARRRLRNVQARVKAACGGLLVRHGESLALRSDTTVDVTEFEAACSRALAAAPEDRPDLAEAALRVSSGPLLPEAVYAPRVARRRDDLDRLAGVMLTIVAAAAEQSGDVEAAVSALARLADVEPWDDAVSDRVAALLHRAGRHRQADAWAERAMRARDD